MLRASATGRGGVVRLLLEKRANVFCWDRDWQTLLMMACMGEEDSFFLQWRELIDLRGLVPVSTRRSSAYCAGRKERVRGLNGTCVAGQLLTWELCMADRSRCKLCYKQTSAGGAAIATTAQVRSSRQWSRPLPTSRQDHDFASSAAVAPHPGSSCGSCSNARMLDPCKP